MRRRGRVTGVNLRGSVVRTAHSLDEHYLRRDDYSPSRGEPGPVSSKHHRATTSPAPRKRTRGFFVSALLAVFAGGGRGGLQTGADHERVHQYREIRT